MFKSFEEWLNEIVAPRKPSGMIKRNNITQNAGTNNPKAVIQYQFKTKLKNIVKVWFKVKGDDSYEVIFYVNDSLKDDSGKNPNGRDPEILPGVLHIIQDKSSSLNAKEITFQAFSDEDDSQVLKNLPIDSYRQKLNSQIDYFSNVLRRFPVEMIPPSQSRIDLFARLNRGVPEPLPNLDTKLLLNLMDDLKMSLESPESSRPAINNVMEKLYSVDWKQFNIDPKPVQMAIKDFEGALESNTESGWRKFKNRRESVYEKLVQRYFARDWKISKSGTFFTLTKI